MNGGAVCGAVRYVVARGGAVDPAGRVVWGASFVKRPGVDPLGAWTCADLGGALSFCSFHRAQRCADSENWRGHYSGRRRFCPVPVFGSGRSSFCVVPFAVDPCGGCRRSWVAAAMSSGADRGRLVQLWRLLPSRLVRIVAGAGDMAGAVLS